MAAASHRMSTYTQMSGSSGQEGKPADTKKDIWNTLLSSVASGKRLPEKNILVLGGTSDSQKDFLEALSVEDTRKAQDRQNSKQPPVANDFALGYTYHDVFDADHEDILARLSVYLLADPSPAFTPLMQPLLTPHTIPNTLIVILLDWSQPWFWLKELRDWIRLLRTLLVSLDEDCKEKMEEVMISWRDRGRGSNSLDGVGNSTGAEGDVTLPLGSGEWEEALGLPLCVVCQNSDHIEVLERERGWKEDEFDFVLQSLRTVLLKHGASLIYTTPSVTSPLQGLIHSSLGIHSLLKRQPIKHNVIDRDKVVVPPNWDSWGKIRVLRDGFDVEHVNNGWSVDIAESGVPQSPTSQTSESAAPAARGAVSVFSETIRDPSLDAMPSANQTDLEVSSLDTQAFLASQVEILERIRQSADVTGMDSSRLINGRQVAQSIEAGDEHLIGGDAGNEVTSRVNEQIGPVSFNMGGIQVDADDMLQRLKDRQAYETPEPTTPGSSALGMPSPGSGVPGSQNEALASFFAGLMKKGGGGGGASSTGSPRVPDPRANKSEM